MTSEHLRLFIAVPAPERWQAWLNRLQQSLERELPGYFRWTAPESWHLTVLFLGSQSPEKLPEIQAALGSVAAETPAPTLTTAELGAPRPLGRPRLVWLRLDDGGVLSDAQRLLQQRLALAGIEFDAKPFVGHLTLGRARRPSRVDLERGIARASTDAGLAPAAEVAHELILYRSRLEPTGARYEVLGRASLQAAS